MGSIRKERDMKAEEIREGKTLKLTVTKKWFDMIVSGEKKEEYREMKSHWISRISKGEEKITSVQFTNGYGKNSPTVIFFCKKITIGLGKEEWGALRNQRYFIIHLGDRATLPVSKTIGG